MQVIGAPKLKVSCGQCKKLIRMRRGAKLITQVKGGKAVNFFCSRACSNEHQAMNSNKDYSDLWR